jgi:hypothetical protein
MFLQAFFKKGVGMGAYVLNVSDFEFSNEVRF